MKPSQRKRIQDRAFGFPASMQFKCYYSMGCEYKQLSTAVLQSGQSYQRSVRTKRVQEIIDNFNPLYLEEVIVSDRDGKYYVVDGQNRIAAFKQMNNGHHCLVSCKVFKGLSYEDEAAMFHHLDEIRGRLKYCDKVRARFEAQDDPDILNISKILRQYDIKWQFSGSNSGREKTISASKTLIDTYKTLGIIMFEQTIRLLVYTWGGKKESLTSCFLRGIGLFVITYAQDADEETFIKKLSKVSPGEINALAKQEVNVSGMDLKYAKVFYSKYNRNATKRLPVRL